MPASDRSLSSDIALAPDSDDLDGAVADERWPSVLQVLDSRAGRLDEAGRALVQRAVRGAGSAELEQVFPTLRGDPVRAAVALELARIAAHAGDTEGGRRWLASCEQVGEPECPVGGEQIAALRTVLFAVVDRDVIAVLLPLSGPHRGLGAEVKAAVELAREGHSNVTLHFYDTAGTEEGSADAVERAARERSPLAILGPVGVAESRAAAHRAASLRIPIAVLAPEQGGALAADGVYRMVVSPSWEAEHAAALAAELQFDRLAVLAPRDGVGREQASAFARAARSMGATVVRRGEYNPTATELEADIKRFLGLDPLTNPRLRRHLAAHGKAGWKTFSPDVDFELLYIPDSVRNASLVASYLPFFNVELRVDEEMEATSVRHRHGGRIPQLVQLMGSSAWHHPSLFARGGEAVEGALLLDVCVGGDYGEVLSDARVEFDSRFSDRTGHSASSLAAQSYDAATLLFEARESIANASQPRQALETALTGARLVDGACGPARVTASGSVARKPVMLRVGRGEFLILER